MTIKSFKPKQILVNCPPDIAATAAALKGDRSLTRYIIEAIDEKNRHESGSMSIGHTFTLPAFYLAPGKLAIYALSDPLDPVKYRYVGKSLHPLGRLHTHVVKAMTAKEDRRSLKDLWILKLTGEGRLPTMTVLDIVDAADGHVAETDWIRHLIAEGHPLENSEDATVAWKKKRQLAASNG